MNLTADRATYYRYHATYAYRVAYAHRAAVYRAYSAAYRATHNANKREHTQ